MCHLLQVFKSNLSFPKDHIHQRRKVLIASVNSGSFGFSKYVKICITKLLSEKHIIILSLFLSPNMETTTKQTKNLSPSSSSIPFSYDVVEYYYYYYFCSTRTLLMVYWFRQLIQFSFLSEIAYLTNTATDIMRYLTFEGKKNNINTRHNIPLE